MNLTVQKDKAPPNSAHHNIWESYTKPIEYGICQTDRKPHERHFRQMNHIRDHHDVVHTHLSEIGLPYKPQDFLVGTGYDLLFLKNYGIVIKVGENHDPVDLIHPCFSQPLWWATDAPSGITTCVYAGEKLAPETLKSFDAIEFLETVLVSGQSAGDVQEKTNIGFAGDLPILLDVDALYNRTACPEKRLLKQALAA